VGSGEKPQPTNDLVHIWAKMSSCGGNNFMNFHRNKFNFLVHLHWSAAITRCTPCTPSAPAQSYPIARYMTAAEARPQSLCAVHGVLTLKFSSNFFVVFLEMPPPESAARGACPPLAPASRHHCLFAVVLSLFVRTCSSLIHLVSK